MIQEQEAPRLVSVGTAAKMLDVSYWTVYRLLQDNTLSSIKVRGALRIPYEELIAYMTPRPHKSR